MGLGQRAGQAMGQWASDGTVCRWRRRAGGAVQCREGDEWTNNRRHISTKDPVDKTPMPVGLVKRGEGKRQRAFSASRNPQGIVEFVLKMCTEADKDDTNFENKCYFELADKRTPKTDDDRILRIFNKLLSVGISCTEKDRFARPIFSEIFARLNDEELQD
ncbi:hypothetical protein niasHT_000638 [Heterodera trifolii]|uniref:Uncharacterized protein n=1 Tax=Heterodera trifolii TaxID=157864 RepID=A0ABD2MBY3_9BILA